MTPPTPDPADAPDWSYWRDMSTTLPGHLEEVLATGIGCGMALVWWDDRDGGFRAHRSPVLWPRHAFLRWTPLAPLLSAGFTRPAPPAGPGGGATVKPLAWDRSDVSEWVAEVPFGEYRIIYRTHDRRGPEFLASFWVERLDATVLGDSLSINRAQEMAQADYAARLDPTPASPDAAARDAVVEAAMLWEDAYTVAEGEHLPDPLWQETMEACGDRSQSILRACRALRVALARGDAP